MADEEFKKTCYNCLKVDVCDIYSDIWDINEEHQFTEYNDLFRVIAPICVYYLHNIDVDENGDKLVKEGGAPTE